MAIDTNYFMQPGESISQYNSRIATYNASKNSPQPAPQSSSSPQIQGLGGGGSYASPNYSSYSATPSAGLVTRTPNSTYTPPAPTQYNPPQVTMYEDATGWHSGSATSMVSPPPTQATNTYGMNSQSPNWYQLQNGESIGNYNARVAAANPNLPAPGTVSSTGVAGLGATSPNVNTATIGSPSGPTPTFGGVVGSLANTSGAGSPLAAAAGQGLMTTAQNQQNYQQAYTAYQNANQQYQSLKSNIAKQFGTMETGDQALPVVLGQEGALEKQYAGQLDALSNEMNSAATAMSAATNEQSTTQSGFNDAASTGNTAQNIAQSGLGAAGTLAQPSGSYPFVFNPLTGSYNNASGGGGSGVLSVQQAAQMAISGQYNQALSGLSYMGSSAEGQLQSEILKQNPQANITQLKAQSTGSENILGNVPLMQAALSTANGFQDNIISLLNANPDLNSSPLTVANSFQQWAEGKQLSDPRVQNLLNMMLEYTNSIAPVLGIPGDPTNLKTEMSTSLLQAAQSNQSIASVLKTMQKAASDKITHYQQGATGSPYQSQVPYTASGAPASSVNWNSLGTL